MNALNRVLEIKTDNRPSGLRGPRADVVMALKGSGLTARVLADELGLSLNAVRHHLKELELSGLVSYERRQPRGVGAPSYQYRLTPAGEALFPRRYEDAVTRLLDHVVAHEGREAAVGVLESRYRELTARLRTALADASPAERLEAVARALAEEGYMPEVRPGDAAGLPMLVEHNCPMQQVALRFPELCEAEARFLAEVLQAEVVREAHMVSGCGSCEYVVKNVNREQ